MDVLQQLTLTEDEAQDFGFQWSNAQQILDQIISEVQEVHEVLNHSVSEDSKEHLQEEIGDLIHAACSLCLFCGFDLEKTMYKSVEKVKLRLQKVKFIANVQGYTTLKGEPFAKLMELWDRAKEELNQMSPK